MRITPKSLRSFTDSPEFKWFYAGGNHSQNRILNSGFSFNPQQFYNAEFFETPEAPLGNLHHARRQPLQIDELEPRLLLTVKVAFDASASSNHRR